MKKLLLSLLLISSVAMASTITLTCTMSDPTPTPVPTVTPTPVPTVTPTPTPTPSVTVRNVQYFGFEKPTHDAVSQLANSATLSIAANETRGFFVKTSSCVSIPTNQYTAFSISAFSAPSFVTTKPSFTGAPVGAQFDPLLPVSSCLNGWGWIDIKALKGTAPGTYTVNVGDLPVTIVVNKLTMPDNASVPLYVEVQPGAIVNQHKLTWDNSVVAPVLLKYEAALRDHRIEPMKQMLSNPGVKSDGSMNLDEFGGVGSFRQVVLTGSTAPVCVRSPSPISSSWTSASELAAWQKSLASESSLVNAWAYLTDEPTDMAGTATRAKLVRTNAPGLKTMVTTEPNASLVGLVDRFVTVMEYFKQPGHWSDYTQAPGYWIYAGCMSHGCGSGTLSGTPDLMIDQADVHDRAFMWMSYALGGAASLYYNATESWSQMDPWTNQYLFGGNGDGTLMYPGRVGENGFTTPTPVSSVRLKMLRQGSFDVEYLKLASATDLKALVPDQFKWQRSHAAIEALRAKVSQ